MQTSKSTTFFTRILCALALTVSVSSATVPANGSIDTRDDAYCPRSNYILNNGYFAQLLLPANDGSGDYYWLSFSYPDNIETPSLDQLVPIITSEKEHAIIFKVECVPGLMADFYTISTVRNIAPSHDEGLQSKLIVRSRLPRLMVKPHCPGGPLISSTLEFRVVAVTTISWPQGHSSLCRRTNVSVAALHCSIRLIALVR